MRDSTIFATMIALQSGNEISHCGSYFDPRILQEINLKALQILIIIMLCTTPLYAEQALLLTEIEKIQENIWYLKKDLAAQKASIKEQQKQIKSISSKSNDQQLARDESFSTLSASVVIQQEKTNQMATDLTSLSKAVTSLTDHIGTQNSSAKEQTGEIEALLRTLQTLRTEFSQKQAASGQALAETREQLAEIRTQLETLGQEVGGRVEKIGLWGAGAVLLLAVILSVAFALRKKKTKAPATTSRQAPPRHEM
jgi:predicted  nucleic acid-binding Zn-ribbon protein